MDPHDQQDDAFDPYEIQPDEDQIDDLGLDHSDGSPTRQFAGPLAPAASPDTIGAAADGSIRQSDLHCVRCGYNLTGITTGSACPECGNLVESSMMALQLPTSNRSITSLVLGICSIPMCVLYGIPSVICGVLAIVFAYTARSQIAHGDVGPGSKGIATAGMICGIIGLSLGLGFLLVFYVLLQSP